MYQEIFDIAILGSGLGGATLAAILGRQGFRVLLIEKEAHPRLALGEALPPQGAMLLWILGERFGVPEIQHLSSTERLLDHVSKACGARKTVGFLYHEAGKRQSPGQSHLFVPPATPPCSGSHLFRQDVDLYLVNAAVRYGVVHRDKTQVKDFEVCSDSVLLRTDKGEKLRARYLVDTSGPDSLVASKLHLRKKGPELRTSSRTHFTHMQGVRRYADTLADPEKAHFSRDWHEGTLHHVFDGGWLWILPFGNVEGAEKPLCSVGLTLDTRKYPHQKLPAWLEFSKVVSQFPCIAGHLKGAEAVRPWVSVEPLQCVSKDCAGERWFLLANAYGFVDPLGSGDLVRTFETIHALAPRLIEALREDDFSMERFEHPRRLQEALLHADDRRVCDAYGSFGSYATWDAWVRLWFADVLSGDQRLFRACLEYLGTGDASVFASLDGDPPSLAVPMEAAEEPVAVLV